MRVALVVITVLASIGFYNYHYLLPDPIVRAMFMGMVIVCGIVGLGNGDKVTGARYPRWLWFLFITGLVVSLFMASFYHHQSLQVSIIASSTVIMAFLFMYVLLWVNPDPEKLFRFFYVLAGVSMVVYFANLWTFPNNMFGPPLKGDFSRGMLRVKIPLFQVIFLLFFYSINQWQIDHGRKWLFAIGGLFTCGILSVTRQVIAIMTILGFFQLLSKLSLTKKILIGGVLACLGVVMYTQLSIFQSMREVSEEQIDATQYEEKEDVRIGAWRYFSYEGNDDVATLLFGNGTPSSTRSVWGRQLDVFMEENGWYMADVSWAGCLYQYGYVTTIILMSIVLMAIFRRKSVSKQYLTYFFLCVLLQGIASGVWLYFYEIAITMIAFYLLYRPDDNDIVDKVTPVSCGQDRIYPKRFITRI